jgi:hypothetical protein
MFDNEGVSDETGVFGLDGLRFAMGGDARTVADFVNPQRFDFSFSYLIPA